MKKSRIQDKEKEEEEKEDMMQFKDVGEEDYRGILAIIVTGGFVFLLTLTLILRPEYFEKVAAVFTGLVSSIVTAYVIKKAEGDKNEK